MLRGRELDSYSLFTFVRDTYEQGNRASDVNPPATGESERRRGRPRNVRSRYLDEHPNAQTKQRIVRSGHHNTLVNIIGHWFPRRDDEDAYDVYCAAMLMLLKPWRDLRSDLKQNGSSWTRAFEVFEASASTTDRITLSGAQYFYECASAADADRAQEGRVGQDHNDQGMVDREADEDGVDVDGDWEHHRDGDVDDDEEMDYGEAGLQALKAMQTSLPEQQYALGALAAARFAGYFPDM
ncbi:hypothetical protein LXA43DRAFT_898929, partial [Ganoderma leucocontextum]